MFCRPDNLFLPESELNTPVRCLFLQEHFLNLLVAGRNACNDILTDESVSAFILESKSGKFHCAEDKQYGHSSPCFVMYRSIYTDGVGYCLSAQGLTRASIR